MLLPSFHKIADSKATYVIVESLLFLKLCIELIAICPPEIDRSRYFIRLLNSYGELNVKRKNQSEKNINLLKEADSKYHFSALLWAYNGDVMSYIGDFDAALFAYTNALSLYSEEIDGAELGKQLQLKRDMLYNNLLEIQEKEVEEMIKNKYSFN